MIFAKNSYKSISEFLNGKYYSTLTAYVKKSQTQIEIEELKNKSIHFVDFFPRNTVHREIITSITKILSSKHNISLEVIKVIQIFYFLIDLGISILMKNLRIQ